MNGKPKTRRYSRRWIPWVGAVALIGLIVAGLWPKPIPVETVTVSQGALRATVNEEGKTRIKQRYLVSAPVTGQLRRIPYKAGAQMVGDETVVAIIDPVSPTLLDPRARAQAEARRDASAANLEKARASHLFAQSELRRSQSLHAQKTISAQELETAQLRETAAEREVAAAGGVLRQAEAELAEFSVSNVKGGSPTGTNRQPLEIKAPVSGRVLRVFEESSRVVMLGTPLVEVGDPADLEVIVEVLSRDGAAIAPGAKVEFEQWGGPVPLQGRVRLVEPSAFTKISALGVEEQRVYVVADLLTPPAERPGVGDNFRVEARIIVWESERTLKVASGALFRRGDQWATFVMKNGKAELRVIQAGRSSGAETQVTDGLREGETIILYPGSRVGDGQRVRPLQL